MARTILLHLCARVAAPHTHCAGYLTLPHSAGWSREAKEPIARGIESPLRSRPTERKVGSAPGRHLEPRLLPSPAEPSTHMAPSTLAPASQAVSAPWLGGEVPEQEGSCKITSHSCIVLPVTLSGFWQVMATAELGPLWGHLTAFSRDKTS